MQSSLHDVETLDKKCPHSQLREFIANAEFPCVGAKSAMNKERLRFGRYASMANESTAAAMCQDLRAFSAEFPDPKGQPASFIATFAETVSVDEAGFEARLWGHLQLMHQFDVHAHPWDSKVSSDPQDKNFSMSIAGRAFFVVGLHPHASRLARRTPMACLVFNFHDQFDALKASGKYASMQAVIRQRDVALQGSINPVLARFGEASEARQYAGRAVAADWVCPFHYQGDE